MSERVKGKLFRSGLPVPLADITAVSARLVRAATEHEWDVLWMDKVLVVSAHSLRRFKGVTPRTLMVGYSPDDMNARHNQSQQYLESLPLYDIFVTTKSYNVGELKALGCPRAL